MYTCGELGPQRHQPRNRAATSVRLFHSLVPASTFQLKVRFGELQSIRRAHHFSLRRSSLSIARSSRRPVRRSSDSMLVPVPWHTDRSARHNSRRSSSWRRGERGGDLQCRRMPGRRARAGANFGVSFQLGRLLLAAVRCCPPMFQLKKMLMKDREIVDGCTSLLLTSLRRSSLSIARSSHRSLVRPSLTVVHRRVVCSPKDLLATTLAPSLTTE